MTIEAKINEAEIYHSMGLLSASLDVYKQIIPDIGELDSDTQDSVKKQIGQLKAEIAEKEENEGEGISDEAISVLKDKLSSHEDVQAIFDSAEALMELGLYKEAMKEYEKLVSIEYPLEEIIPDITDCLFKINSPAYTKKKVEQMIKDCHADREQVSQIKLAFGKEFEKRNKKKIAYDFYRSAKALAPQDSEINERLDSLMASFSTGSRYDYLISRNFVATEKLQRALKLSKKTKKSVEFHLLKNFMVKKDELGKSLSMFYGCPFRSYDPDLPPPLALLEDLKMHRLISERWIPLGFMRGGIEVLVDDPKDLRKTDYIRAQLNTKRIRFCVGTKEDIEFFIKRFFYDKGSIESEETEKGVNDGLMHNEYVNAQDKRREERITPKQPDFMHVEFKLFQTAGREEAHSLDVMNYSKHGLGLLIKRNDFKLLQVLQPGDFVKDIYFYASWAIMKVDARVAHFYQIHEGQYRGNYIMGLELSDALEGDLPEE